MEFTMPRTCPPYRPQYRQQVVDLGCAGRSPEEPARAYVSTDKGILNWVKQADLDEGRRHDCLTTVESEQLFLDHASPFRYEMVHAYEA